MKMIELIGEINEQYVTEIECANEMYVTHSFLRYIKTKWILTLCR